MDIWQYLEIAGVAVGLLYLYFEYQASVWLWLTGIIMPALYIFVYYESGFYADMGINIYYLFAGFYGWAAWLGQSRKNKLLPSGAMAGVNGSSEAGVMEAVPAFVSEPLTETGAAFSSRADLDTAYSAEAASDYKPYIGVASGIALPIEGAAAFNSGSSIEVAADIPAEFTTGTAMTITRTPTRFWLPLSLIAVASFAAISYILINFTDSTVPLGDSFTTALSIVALWMLARKYVEQWLVWIAVDVICSGLYLYKGLYLTGALFGLYSIIAVFGYFKWLRLMKQGK